MTREELVTELQRQREALHELNKFQRNADTALQIHGEAVAGIRAAIVAQTLELRRIADALEERNKR